MEEKSKFHNLQALNTALFHVFRVKQTYQRIQNMPSFAEGIHLSFTAVNAVSNTLGFFLKGLPQVSLG